MAILVFSSCSEDTEISGINPLEEVGETNSAVIIEYATAEEIDQAFIDAGMTPPDWDQIAKDSPVSYNEETMKKIKNARGIRFKCSSSTTGGAAGDYNFSGTFSTSDLVMAQRYIIDNGWCFINSDGSINYNACGVPVTGLPSTHPAAKYATFDDIYYSNGSVQSLTSYDINTSRNVLLGNLPC